MKIFIEGYAYAPEVVNHVLPEKRVLLTNEKVTIENVGYFHNPECEDFVFFLPKVLLEPIEGIEGDRVFVQHDDAGNIIHPGFTPEELINQTALSETQRNFLYEFAVWIYRAIAQYKAQHPHTTAVWEQKGKTTGSFQRKYVTHTLLDVILALQRFNLENQDYFRFKVKEKHTGHNKINWTRTIAKSPAIIQKGQAFYPQPRNKKRTIDFDEELLILFYSILHYIQKTFGFTVHIQMGYDLITGKTFDRYLKGYGAIRLRQIKYKYFSDRDLTLWRLCYAFFDKAHSVSILSGGEEYLLAKNFEIIFESIIDELIGDKTISTLRDLDDGKTIDHLYLDDSLTRHHSNNQTLYIADSKYYKRRNALSRESIAKQFTYARNLIQLDLDLFLSGDNASEKVRKQRNALKGVGLLRDNATEGYDILPNFFISATLADNLSYEKDGLDLHPGSEELRNAHFTNRLFDRDTLILSHYDVNFLYVIKLYAQNNSTRKSEWRNKVRAEFRKHIRKRLSEKFNFYAMMPYDQVSNQQASDFLRENFRNFLGKVYTPYPKLNGKSVYSLALENPANIENNGTLSPEGFEAHKSDIAKENEKVRRQLETTFYIEPCDLGENPAEILIKKATTQPTPGVATASVLDNIIIVEGHCKGHIDAVRTSGYCPWDKTQSSNPYAKTLIIFPHTNHATTFHIDTSEDPILMPIAEVKSKYPAFQNVEFPFNVAYVWKILQQ